jgi:flagellar hook-associated protein 1
MLGLFSTLNLASRSLQTQMAGVEVAGQNLANVNTTGYSRQRVVIETSAAVPTGVGPQGTGAHMAAIQQIVDSLLNDQIQSQASLTGFWDAQQRALQYAQTNLNEFLTGTTTDSTTSSSTSSSGLSEQLNGFFNAFQSVATSPTSMSARQALVSQAQALASSFNQISARLDTLRGDLNLSLQKDADSVNQFLDDIAQLNGQIANLENTTGGTANDLRDQREQKLEGLSKLLNFSMTTTADGSVDVIIDGQTLVSGNQVADRVETYDAGAGTGQLLLRTVSTQTPLALASGSIQGTIDARDGALSNLNTQLEALADEIIAEVNALHRTGYSLTGQTAGDFFSGTGAATIKVSDGIVNDPSSIQAASSLNAAGAAPGDNTVALALANLGSAPLAYLNGLTYSQYYSNSVAELGDALQLSNAQVSNQQTVTTMLTNRRNSVSGVSLDEEMTSLIQFQRAYEASAHLVTTVDQMLQIILNMKS